MAQLSELALGTGPSARLAMKNRHFYSSAASAQVPLSSAILEACHHYQSDIGCRFIHTVISSIVAKLQVLGELQ